MGTENNLKNSSIVPNEAEETQLSQLTITNRLDRLESEINLLVLLQKNREMFKRNMRDSAVQQIASDQQLQQQPNQQPYELHACGHVPLDTLVNGQQELPVPKRQRKPSRHRDCVIPPVRQMEQTEISIGHEDSRSDRPNKGDNSVHFDGDEDNRSNYSSKKSSRCEQCAKNQLHIKVEVAPLNPRSLKRRSKSLDTQKIMRSYLKCENVKGVAIMPAAQQTAGGKLVVHEDHVRDLCDLISELNKNKDIAIAISNQWKEKFIDMEKNCRTLRELQERADQQSSILTVCFQNEQQHRILLERIVSHPKFLEQTQEMDLLKETLDNRNQQNVELMKMCEELRAELHVNEERFRRLQRTNCELVKDILSRLETLKRRQGQYDDATVETYKKTIEQLQNDMQELQMSCAKNAEWACEESVEKSRLLTENKYLKRKFEKLVERDRDQIERINTLRQHLLHAQSGCGIVTKTMKPTKDVDTNTDTSLLKLCPNDSDEAPKLINELSSVIQLQRSRIQELMSMSTSIAPTFSAPVTNHNVELQSQELTMARKEIEDVRERYIAMQQSVKSLKETVKKSKEELSYNEKSRVTLQNEVNMLNKLVNEANDNLMQQQQLFDEQAEKVLTLQRELIDKDEKIVRLSQELHQATDDVENLNFKLRELQKERDHIRNEYDVIRLDMSRQEEIIMNLEKTFALQRREIELQREVINHEKEQALRAAQFATNKLMETMEDFRKQNDSQSQIRNVLTQLLKEKDDQLKSTIEKMSSLTFDPQKIIDAFRLFKPRHSSRLSDPVESNDSFETALTIPNTYDFSKYQHRPHEGSPYDDSDMSLMFTRLLHPKPSASNCSEKDETPSEAGESYRTGGVFTDENERKWYEAAQMYMKKYQTEGVLYSMDPRCPSNEDLTPRSGHATKFDEDIPGQTSTSEIDSALQKLEPIKEYP